MSPALLTGTCLLALSLQASAAQMTASFTQEASSTWHVDLAVSNDGTDLFDGALQVGVNFVVGDAQNEVAGN